MVRFLISLSLFLIALVASAQGGRVVIAHVRPGSCHAQGAQIVCKDIHDQTVTFQQGTIIDGGGNVSVAGPAPAPWPTNPGPLPPPPPPFPPPPPPHTPICYVSNGAQMVPACNVQFVGDCACTDPSTGITYSGQAQ